MNLDDPEQAKAYVAMMSEKWERDRDREAELMKLTYETLGDGPGCWKLKCVFCGESFLAKTPRAKYCSYRCTNDYYIAWRKNRDAARRKKICGHCGDEFTGGRRDAKFCSSACRQANYRALRKPVAVTLPQRRTVTRKKKRKRA